jgi:hypothetical protein
MVVAPVGAHERLADSEEDRGVPASGPSRREVVLWLFAFVVLSTALRIALLARVHAPSVFMDELGYERLAHSIGQSGTLALFGKEGLSYSPLYSAMLAPIYALGASAPTAYEWIKVFNALLMSLSVVPIYKIARFVLPRRSSLIVSGLSVIAPLMLYTSFVMSENLAYPLVLVSVWAMLEAVRAPGLRSDALLLVSIFAASAARLQLIVLLPAALTAVVLAGVFGREPVKRSLVRAARQHVLLLGSGVALLVVAGVGALLGQGLSVAGRYAVVGRVPIPSPWRVLELAVQHFAGLDLALGVFPLVAALVAAFVFFRSDARRSPFAAVALSVTGWLLLETAYDAAAFGEELPRLHERYLVYLVPLFLVALLATVRLPESKAPSRVYLAASVPAALLPVVIPFHSVINISSVVDSFGLQLFALGRGDDVVPIPHVTVVAVWAAATFALTYFIVRKRMRGVVVLALFVFIVMSTVIRTRIEGAGTAARDVLPAHRDWVDRPKPPGDVILVAGQSDVTSALETAFYNLSITRVYTVCNRVFGPDFGEQRISIDKTGRLRGSAGIVNARYAVVPVALGVRGRVVARNSKGRELLVAAANGVLRVSAAKHDKPSCV